MARALSSNSGLITHVLILLGYLSNSKAFAEVVREDEEFSEVVPLAISFTATCLYPFLPITRLRSGNSFSSLIRVSLISSVDNKLHSFPLVKPSRQYRSL